MEDVRDVAAMIPAVLGADDAAISRVVPGEDCVEDISRHDWSSPGERYRLSDYPATEYVLRTRTAGQVVVGDPASDPAEVQLLERAGHQAVLMVPLVFGGNDVGLLELYRRHAMAWNSGEIERAQLLAHQLAAVLDLLARDFSRARAEPRGTGAARRARLRRPMAILVDELREYPDVALPFTVWCHMATDGSFEELHEFAARLGLRRAWFQRDHYDLPAHGRAAAVVLGAEEVATPELLLRMAGPRGERARRRTLAPAGVTWLRGPGGPAVLRYPAGALVVIGGPPGAGRSTLAARVVDRAPVLDADGARAAELRGALAAGGGAVAVATALRQRHRLALAEAASGGRRGGAPRDARRRRGDPPRRSRRPGRAAGLRPRAAAARVAGVPPSARGDARRVAVRLDHGARPRGRTAAPPGRSLTLESSVRYRRAPADREPERGIEPLACGLQNRCSTN